MANIFSTTTITNANLSAMGRYIMGVHKVFLTSTQKVKLSIVFFLTFFKNLRE